MKKYPTIRIDRIEEEASLASVASNSSQRSIGRLPIKSWIVLMRFVDRKDLVELAECLKVARRRLGVDEKVFKLIFV